MSGVLVDTSVWVDHFRRRSEALVGLLEVDRVCIHPFVLGELACGTPPDRVRTLGHLAQLRGVQQPTLAEVMTFTDRERLYGRGCGIVDLTLLAAALVTPGVRLWTLDQRLAQLASHFRVAHEALH
ncbi:MAG: type II toxin-antitoxin system VapC family toxin [Burkholderiales bacterium]|jgi:predicted nucleic acid-binding protein